jgi:predicted nucleic acid-binding protein
VIILDTNVISELMKADPAAAVLGWVGRRRGADLFTTAVNHAEVLYGIEVMPRGRRRESLSSRAVEMFERYFRDRILSFDHNAARAYAAIVAHRERTGRPIDELDAQIAAIAADRRMSIATRDAGGFEDCGIEVVNPWAA